MRMRAIAALSDILRDNGELLPLATDDGTELYVFNCLRIIDALELERSDVKFVPGTQRIAIVSRYSFRTEQIQDLEVFRLPFRTSPTFVGERFVDLVTRHDLKGIEFERVWPG